MWGNSRSEKKFRPRGRQESHSGLERGPLAIGHDLFAFPWGDSYTKDSDASDNGSVLGRSDGLEGLAEDALGGAAPTTTERLLGSHFGVCVDCICDWGGRRSFRCVCDSGVGGMAGGQ